jgi:hypothetical protein
MLPTGGGVTLTRSSPRPNPRLSRAQQEEGEDDEFDAYGYAGRVGRRAVRVTHGGGRGCGRGSRGGQYNLPRRGGAAASRGRGMGPQHPRANMAPDTGPFSAAAAAAAAAVLVSSSAAAAAATGGGVLSAAGAAAAASAAAAAAARAAGGNCCNSRRLTAKLKLSSTFMRASFPPDTAYPLDVLVRVEIEGVLQARARPPPLAARERGAGGTGRGVGRCSPACVTASWRPL